MRDNGFDSRLQNNLRQATTSLDIHNLNANGRLDLDDTR